MKGRGGGGSSWLQVTKENAMPANVRIIPDMHYIPEYMTRSIQHPIQLFFGQLQKSGSMFIVNSTKAKPNKNKRQPKNKTSYIHLKKNKKTSCCTPNQDLNRNAMYHTTHTLTAHSGSGSLKNPLKNPRNVGADCAMRNSPPKT